MSYVTLDDIRAYLEIGSSGDADELTRIAAAAQQEIERFCHQGFESSTSVRYYRERDLRTLPDGSLYTPASQWSPIGNPRFSWDAGYGSVGSKVLPLDKPLLSLTTLTNGDGTVISSTGYWLEPRNDAPYLFIRLRSSESWVFETDGEVSVDGSWGYSTAPDATIVQLTLEMAGYLYHSRQSPVYDVTATPELGVITVPKGMPQHVKYVLERGGYVRKAGRVIV